MITEVDHAAAEFRKRAETPADAERLGNEAAVLTVARHPGVVQLLGWDGTTLRLRLIDGSHPADLAPLAATVATTLADLHDIGVAHGAVRAEHILVDSLGNAVLCGFGHGRIAVRPGGPEAAADIAALAEVLGAGAGDRRQRAALPRRVRSARQLASRLVPPAPRARSARQLASRLAPPAPRARSAGQLASRLAPPAPGARSAGQSAPPVAPGAARARHRKANPSERSAGQPARRRPATWAVAMVAVVVAVAVAGAVVIAGARGGEPAVAACPTVDRGCRPLPRPGGVIALPTGRYRVGRPGDVVVIGRWTCRDGLPALLEPGTGAIWVWDVWAGQGLPQPARRVARVTGAASMLVDPGRSGCDRLRVTRRQGGTVIVDPRPAHDRLAPWPGVSPA